MIEKNFKDPLVDTVKDQLVMYIRAYIMHIFKDLIFTGNASNKVLVFILTLFKDF